MNFTGACLTTVLVSGSLLAGAGPALAAGEAGTVYTESNASSGNRVLVFHRAVDGSLTPAGSVASGGMGTGAPLASQGALALGGDGDWLFAVNAGRHSISSFRVRKGGLELAATARGVSGSGFKGGVAGQQTLLRLWLPKTQTLFYTDRTLPIAYRTMAAEVAAQQKQHGRRPRALSLKFLLILYSQPP